jgi:hypothetical protein
MRHEIYICNEKRCGFSGTLGDVVLLISVLSEVSVQIIFLCVFTLCPEEPLITEYMIGMSVTSKSSIKH